MIGGVSMAAEDDPQFVTALARGLSVLRCFSRSSPVLGTTEIARMLGLPQPTVWRLCHTLLKLRYLRATGDNRLCLGIGCLGLGYEVLTQHGVAELALPSMRDVAHRFQGAVSLGIPDGGSVVYVQRCASKSIVLANLAVGSRVPLVSSAIGWAFLASMGEDERGGVVAALDDPDRQAFARVEPAFREALSAFATCGFVQANGILHPDINAVAVPIRAQAAGQPPYLLSCGGVASAFSAPVLEEAGSALVRLAADIGSALPR
jgi:DNA-binding IclR family transcriptional regulator